MNRSRLSVSRFYGLLRPLALGCLSAFPLGGLIWFVVGWAWLVTTVDLVSLGAPWPFTGGWFIAFAALLCVSFVLPAVFYQGLIKQGLIKSKREAAWFILGFFLWFALAVFWVWYF